MKKILFLVLVLLLITSIPVFADDTHSEGLVITEEKLLDNDIGTRSMGPCPIHGTHEAYQIGFATVFVNDAAFNNYEFEAAVYRCIHCGRAIYIEVTDGPIEWITTEGYMAEGSPEDVRTHLKAVQRDATWDDFRLMGWILHGPR